MAHSTAEVISSHMQHPSTQLMKGQRATQSLLPQGYLNSVLHLT